MLVLIYLENCRCSFDNCVANIDQTISNGRRNIFAGQNFTQNFIAKIIQNGAHRFVVHRIR